MNTKTFTNALFGSIEVLHYKNTPCFDAVSIAKILGYTNPSKALSDHCKCLISLNYNETLESNFGEKPKGIKLLKESDLYRLVMHSKLPQAEKFQDWVVEEVLPSLRNNGGYVVGQEAMTDEEYLASALIMAQKKLTGYKERVTALEFALSTTEEKVEMMKPKADFHDAVATSKNGILVRDLAKALIKDGKTIKEKDLRQWMKDNDMINQFNRPYAKHTQAGHLMETLSVSGEHQNYTTRITGKGVTYITKKLLKQNLIDTFNEATIQ